MAHPAGIARQFAYCVHQMNLLGLATCQVTEYSESYNLLGQCSASTYHIITWTCCPQESFTGSGVLCGPAARPGRTCMLV
ncbi:hypothetical protein [Hyalangium sp.]|uniref:hypothetical protein n=1 Tax=Hyalangium sp. TaxID=2028555 RepID=UPI002D35EE00|nr:hypothetical protein [Hyalangium sp.]HYH94733.1 hypothetical protein [Hyalangium sp.]